MIDSPTLKLYEPPLDVGEDEDEPEIPPESRHAAFFVCLIFGSSVAALIWIAASHVVP